MPNTSQEVYIGRGGGGVRSRRKYLYSINNRAGRLKYSRPVPEKLKLRSCRQVEHRSVTRLRPESRRDDVRGVRPWTLVRVAGVVPLRTGAELHTGREPCRTRQAQVG